MVVRFFHLLPSQRQALPEWITRKDLEAGVVSHSQAEEGCKRKFREMGVNWLTWKQIWGEGWMSFISTSKVITEVLTMHA